MARQRGFFPENPLYFATMTVVGWVDVFTREKYIEALYESWQYCVQHKGLRVHAYVVMSNHVHWIISTQGLPLSDIVRDTKKFTAKAIFNQIEKNSQESRKEWMLNMFQYVGRNQTRNKEIQFWKHGNHATDLWSNEVIHQKIQYIHHNPVRAGIVDEPSHYRHSSARAYEDTLTPFPVEPIWL